MQSKFYDGFATIHRTFLTFQRTLERSTGLYLKTKSGKQKPIQRQFGSAKGFFVLHDDFNEPLEDFKDYM